MSGKWEEKGTSKGECGEGERVKGEPQRVGRGRSLGGERVARWVGGKEERFRVW